MSNLRFINNIRVNNSIINYSKWCLSTMRPKIERQNVFYNTLSGYLKVKPNSSTKSISESLNFKSFRHLFSVTTSSPYSCTDFKTNKFISGSYHLSTFVVLTLNKSDNLYYSHISNCRHKSTRKKRNVKPSKDEEFEDDDEEEEDNLDDENEAAKDYKDIKANLNSLRLDVVLKHGLGMSRSKVEEVFYESRIRVNGKKMLKKSTQMQVGNEIDWIKGVNSENENFLNISRVIVQRIENRGETEKMQVVLRRFKNMVIENYDTPWNNSTED
ncbi:uncharacterized protein LOC143222335 [Tachypleus tridentatus]|uniref:uncharacterized protein LOC143222335 n=1 Tax=Tachypleus tridentatus TaxID=6853 RepID=UPI003FD392BA